jgi:uncharacterized protein YjbJ (UPF0337 family)
MVLTNSLVSCTRICSSLVGIIIALPGGSTLLEKEHVMNWDQIEGKWHQLKGKVKQQWGKLTEDDLDVIAGKKEQLSGKLQERYGYAKDEADRQIDEWHRGTDF